MTAELPSAVANLFRIRGFAWATELGEAHSLAPGDLPLYSESREALPGIDARAPDEGEPTFPLAVEIAALDSEERQSHLRTLDFEEQQILKLWRARESTSTSPPPDSVDEDVESDEDITRTTDDTEQPAEALNTRAERVEALRYVEVELGDGADDPELASRFALIRGIRQDLFRDSIRLAITVLRGRVGLLDRNMALLAACSGLDVALDRFEPSRGTQFSTYAVHWVRHRLGRQRDQDSVPLRVPVHALDHARQYLVEERRQWCESGYRPTPEAVAAGLEIEDSSIRRILEMLPPVLPAFLVGPSLNSEALAERVEGPSLPSLWQGGVPSVWVSRTFAMIEEAISRGGKNNFERAEDILRRRLALGRPTREPLREVGDRFNISRERVRQIQKQSLSLIQRRIEGDRSPMDVRPWGWRLRKQ